MVSLSKLEEWAAVDAQLAYQEEHPLDYYLESAEIRRPENVRNKKQWRRTCIDYLLESYVWRVRMVEQLDKKQAIYDAYVDAFEWLYCISNPGGMKSRVMKERGW